MVEDCIIRIGPYFFWGGVVSTHWWIHLDKTIPGSLQVPCSGFTITNEHFVIILLFLSSWCWWLMTDIRS